MTRNLIAMIACLLTLGYAYAEDKFASLQVSAADNAPTIDGDLSDWKTADFTALSITSAIEDDADNAIGDASIDVAMQVIGDRIYMAVRWPDPTMSDNYRPYEWKVNRYKRGKQRDDLLAVRFSLSDAFDRSMLTTIDYEVDVWVWSAGRSNLIGFADDYKHHISTQHIQDAAEYELPDGTIVYIDRSTDTGEFGYGTQKPESSVKTTQKVDSVSIEGPNTGSLGDVIAKGQWHDGYWTVELSRLRDTQHADDRALLAGDQVITQFAVFDENNAEHKSVSEPYRLVLPD
jgi:hypothetical protein